MARDATMPGEQMADATVNEVVRAFPTTMPVFARSGIDTCCGGGLSVRDAASRHGIDLETLLDDLGAAARSG